MCKCTQSLQRLLESPFLSPHLRRCLLYFTSTRYGKVLFTRKYIFVIAMGILYMSDYQILVLISSYLMLQKWHSLCPLVIRPLVIYPLFPTRLSLYRRMKTSNAFRTKSVFALPWRFNFQIGLSFFLCQQMQLILIGIMDRSFKRNMLKGKLCKHLRKKKITEQQRQNIDEIFD